jgi:hypothetical protein
MKARASVKRAMVDEFFASGATEICKRFVSLDSSNCNNRLHLCSSACFIKVLGDRAARRFPQDRARFAFNLCYINPKNVGKKGV